MSYRFYSALPPEEVPLIQFFCINGHGYTITRIESESDINSNSKQVFCDKCGAVIVTKCLNCDSPIRVVGSFASRPSFCTNCGKSYPWTEAKLKAAQELADELENLSPEERNLLKKSFDDIIRDTPQTMVAATRIKNIVAKADKTTADSFRYILVDIASEAVKKVIWP